MNRLEGFKRWTFSQALSYYYINLECCASEFTQTVSCRYDLERFGIKESSDIEQANVLVVSGPISPESGLELKNIYERMSYPKWVISVGGCSCSGKLFETEPLEKVISVDIFVPGCPPRPEAIMYGFLQLQKKIMEKDFN